uniref:Transport permease protein n=1 Tax=Candidatus Kentrum sp. LPFa TaxID=2126335 RepID=A0A450W1D9_9GAMM|nr:MAG: lipopolysaccharide transport system permease protein [Candidatus Kentron sp. LPFa]VFK27309.1 MAG: lipopolysaccharide transport system permease protein [Candidatus Kentron sp. LPFa]
MLHSLWRYRHFILSSIRNDLITRFVRSKLGGLWIIINPLAQVAIYALILSNILGARLPGIDNKYAYAIYLMAGLLAWTLFTEILNRCLNLFIEHGNLMKKMNFPRITLPAIVVGSNLINNGLLLIAMLGIFLLLGHHFSLIMLWLLPLTVILTGFSLGIGLVLGVINVFLRDIGQVIPIILQVCFWFTPIVYPANIIPETYRHWLNLNPIYHFTSAYQNVLVYGRPPQFEGLIVISALTLLLLLLSLFLFRRANEEMMDAL